MGSPIDEYVAAARADPTNPCAGLHVVYGEYLRKKMETEIMKKREIFWITVNPKPDIEFHEFRELILDRVIKRTFMKDCHVVFEQRAKKEPYHGIHAHILVEKRMSPKQMFDRIFNTCKDVLGNKKALDIRHYPYSYHDDKLDYMKGKKWDPEKDPSVAATIKWRMVNGLLDIYRQDMDEA